MKLDKLKYKLKWFAIKYDEEIAYLLLIISVGLVTYFFSGGNK